MNTISRHLRWPPLTSLITITTLMATDAVTASGQESGNVGLPTLVRAALDSNSQLVAAREAYNLASEQVSEAWGSVMPTVDLNASYQRNLSVPVNFLPAAIFDPSAGPDDYLPVQFGADNQWNSAISVEQPLFRPGVIVALGAAQRFENLQVEAVRLN